MAIFTEGFPGGSVVKNPPGNAGEERGLSSPRVGKIPWRRAWQPTPVILLENSHGQRSLAGYSPWGHKESDTTKQLSIAQHSMYIYWGFPGSSTAKESTCNAGDSGLIPWSGRLPGEGNGYPLQYSRLENSMDKGTMQNKNTLRSHFTLVRMAIIKT